MGGEKELTFGQRASLKWAAFRKFLWNGETREFLGRGGKSWAQISIFYFFFYSALAAFWACMLLIFMQTIDFNRPTWTAYVSTPGLAVTPSFLEERITFSPSNENTFKKATDALQQVWDSLDEENQQFAETCDPPTEPGNKTVQQRCKFDRTDLGQWCTPDNYFGYNTTEPCVFVKMNKVWGWIPEDPTGDVKFSEYVPGNILVTCRPYKDKDAPGLNSTTVYPPMGIPFAYFPYVTGTSRKEQAKYVTPYVAVRVSLNLEEAAGRDVKILCEAYTGNIDPRGGLYDTDARSEFTVIFKIEKPSAN